MGDELASALPPAGSITLAVCCALGSAMFSGLTLGLLTLDIVQLKLLINRPNKTPQDERNARHARKILPLRSDGNYLLVTLLTGNVAVNAGFSILLGDLTDGLVGFLVSTVVITIFGEIIPQAACARHGLLVGGLLAPVVYALEWLLFPVVKPIAMILNWVLGEDLGTIYDKKQLSALVDYHDNVVHVLTRDEARILKGGLEFAFTRAEEVMTPLEEVYGIDVDSRLNYDVLADVLSSGFSRIPVFDRGNSQCIVGLLFVKDLILVDYHAEVEVRTLLQFFGRGLYAVDDDTPLLELLKTFKQGETHLAVVRRVADDGEGDPFYMHVGIITLEDVLEEILQDEINDEFERDKSRSHRRRHPRLAPAGDAGMAYFSQTGSLAPRLSVSSNVWPSKGEEDAFLRSLAAEESGRAKASEKSKPRQRECQRKLWSRGGRRRGSTGSSHAPLNSAECRGAIDGESDAESQPSGGGGVEERQARKGRDAPSSFFSRLCCPKKPAAEWRKGAGATRARKASANEARSNGGAADCQRLLREMRSRGVSSEGGGEGLEMMPLAPVAPPPLETERRAEEDAEAEDATEQNEGICTRHLELFPSWGWRGDRSSYAAKLLMRGKLKMFYDSHHRTRTAEPFTATEGRAIASFLSSSTPAFSPQIVQESLLVSLLSFFCCIQPPPGSLLWRSPLHPEILPHRKAGERTGAAAFQPFAVVILYGRVRLYVGEEAIPCTTGPWSCLALKALGSPPPFLLGQASSERSGETGAVSRSPSPVPQGTAPSASAGEAASAEPVWRSAASPCANFYHFAESAAHAAAFPDFLSSSGSSRASSASAPAESAGRELAGTPPQDGVSPRRALPAAASAACASSWASSSSAASHPSRQRLWPSARGSPVALPLSSLPSSSSPLSAFPLGLRESRVHQPAVDAASPLSTFSLCGAEAVAQLAEDSSLFASRLGAAEEDGAGPVGGREEDREASRCTPPADADRTERRRALRRSGAAPHTGGSDADVSNAECRRACECALPGGRPPEARSAAGRWKGPWRCSRKRDSPRYAPLVPRRRLLSDASAAADAPAARTASRAARGSLVGRHSQAVGSTRVEDIDSDGAPRSSRWRRSQSAGELPGSRAVSQESLLARLRADLSEAGEDGEEDARCASHSFDAALRPRWASSQAGGAGAGLGARLRDGWAQATASNSNASLQSVEADVEGCRAACVLEDPQRRVHLEEVCVCGVSLPWSPAAGARGEGAAYEAERAEDATKNSADFAAASRRRDESLEEDGKPATCLPRLPFQTHAARSKPRKNARERSPERNYLFHWGDLGAGSSGAAQETRQGKEGESEDARHTCVDPKSRPQQTLEEQMRMQNLRLRHAARRLQEELGCDGAQERVKGQAEGSSAQTGEEEAYAQSANLDAELHQDLLNGNTGLRAMLSTEEGEKAGKKQTKDKDLDGAGTREALWREIDAWVQSEQKMEAERSDDGHVAKPRSVGVYTPDYTAITEGSCGLLVIPRWFYVLTVKASLDLERKRQARST
ncbi:CBS domain-containing protein [Besnoitia besnoiti]|uniref:CBS domain-containing protein n=1 Tax=Besnoitia besnoiti TaxID=94643 RepID=A0A2A9M7R4_BESBE|nr:CBS domain-containing protein [Besnoitia besnoiti]PFH32331.1 CBS domain-containing protein [Besnoitia besnoiti]